MALVDWPFISLTWLESIRCLMPCCKAIDEPAAPVASRASRGTPNSNHQVDPPLVPSPVHSMKLIVLDANSDKDMDDDDDHTHSATTSTTPPLQT